jgi:hypothetical protein
MWASLLRGGFGELLALASPSLFSLLPARDVERALRALTTNRRNTERLESVKSDRRDALVRARVPVALDAAAWRAARSAEKMGDLSGLQLPPREVGARALELYFHQIFDDAPTLLEVHSKTFAQRDGILSWSGGNLFIEWDRAFLAQLRELYVAYYTDEKERFRSALEPLGLSAAEDELRTHFGGQNPRAVAFKLGTFRSTFIAILKRCRDAGARLHPDFIPLGIYLVCLYEHMEALGGTSDVKGAFDKVQTSLIETPRRNLSEQSAAL